MNTQNLHTQNKDARVHYTVLTQHTPTTPSDSTLRYRPGLVEVTEQPMLSQTPNSAPTYVQLCLHTQTTTRCPATLATTTEPLRGSFGVLGASTPHTPACVHNSGSHTYGDSTTTHDDATAPRD